MAKTAEDFFPITHPMVSAIMLVNGRHDMVKRAIASFVSQDYPTRRRRLIVWNTGPDLNERLDLGDADVWFPSVDAGAFAGATIGKLRNAANKYALHHYLESWTMPDVLVHWDSDDWSAPSRIRDQVSTLLRTPAGCVGYRELLFWRTGPDALAEAAGNFDRLPWFGGDAFLYRNPDPRYVVGSSMMMLRAEWERCIFREVPHEDHDWWLRNSSNCHGTSATTLRPQMICAIHGGNSSEAYRPEKLVQPAWTRVPEWDDYCGRTMAL